MKRNLINYEKCYRMGYLKGRADERLKFSEALDVPGVPQFISPNGLELADIIKKKEYPLTTNKCQTNTE